MAGEVPVPLVAPTPVIIQHPQFSRRKLLWIYTLGFGGAGALVLAIYLLATYFPFRP